MNWKKKKKASHFIIASCTKKVFFSMMTIKNWGLIKWSKSDKHKYMISLICGIIF